VITLKRVHRATLASGISATVVVHVVMQILIGSGAADAVIDALR
jgi:hypothetical protein